MTVFRIGTRTSLLAMAQATLVKEALQKRHADMNIQLVGIETEGDQGDNSIEQKDFTGALHQAVMDGRVDCAVHAFKDIHQTQTIDLGSVIMTARDDPRDVVVFRTDILDVLRIGKPIILGTSTVLRAHAVPSFLKNALPSFNDEVTQIETRLLRGTVEERLRQLNEGIYDAVVLAVAGLNRLQGAPLIDRLLSDKKFMVMPLTECPTAPGQGALAIEYRADDKETYALLSPLQDISTADHVIRELQAAKPLGDCVGATSITTRHFPDHILFVKGIDQYDNAVNSISYGTDVLSQTVPENLAWDGTTIRSKAAHTDYLSVDPSSVSASHIFIAHSRAADPALIRTLKNKNIWTSGSQSWFRLARQGVWVQGCTEELGHTILLNAIEYSMFLHLPVFAEWQVLTHDQSGNDWPPSQLVATYSIKNLFDPQAAAAIKTAKHLFWSSVSQYDLYKDHVANDCFHYCRAGKTAEALKACNLPSLTIFPNSEMWRRCLTIQS